MAANVLSRRMALIGLALAGGMIVGLAAGYGPLLRYESEATIDLPGSLPEYRQFQEILRNPHNVDRFVQNGKFDPELAARFKRIATSSNVKSDVKWLRPLFRITRADAKDVAEPLSSNRARDETQEQVVIGVRIAIRQEQPEKAHALVRMAGDYTRSILLRDALERAYLDARVGTRRKHLDTTNELIRTEFRLAQAKTQLTDLRSLAARYPDQAKLEARQVINTDRTALRSLSPMTQAVAAESLLIDLRSDVRALKRQAKQLDVRTGLIEAWGQAIASTGSGPELLARLQTMTKEALKATTDDDAFEVIYEMSSAIDSLEARYISSARYLFGPTLPTSPVSDSPLRLGLVLGFLAALVTAAFVYRDRLKRLITAD